ncbi:MAG: OadG family protein [Clostridia bacterium]|nr:OadG family protein [Clostridia bacterium]
MNQFFSNLGYGAMVTVIGLAVVFIGLILIICSIYAISAILNSKKKKTRKEAAAPVPAPAAPTEPEPIVETEEVNDTELIAVIAAAIAAMDGSNKSLVIRSVRRVTGWKNAARAEQVFKY